MTKINLLKQVSVIFLILLLFALLTISVGSFQIPKQIPYYHGYSYETLWTRIWCDQDFLNTHGGKVAIDSQDNVVSYVYSGTENHYLIKKYNSAGIFCWEIVVDYSDINIEQSVNLGQYTERGEEPQDPPLGPLVEQIQMLDDSPNGSYFKIHSICIDNDDDIIIIAERYVIMQEPPNHFFIFVLKYDSNGNELWKQGYQYMEIYPEWDSTVDSDGNIYIPCSNNFFAYVLKLDCNGDVDWFKPMSLIIPYWSWSVALDSNENPVASALYLYSQDPSIDQLLLVKFNRDTGIKIIQSVIEIPHRWSIYADAALAVDQNDNSVFYGAADTVWKIDASLQHILLTIQHTPFVYDLKIVDEKLIACGGLIDDNGVIKYCPAVYNKNTGTKLLNLVLNPLLYCEDPQFQLYFNQLFGIGIDSQKNVIFSGGGGGIDTN